jgi:hypothetical protein
MTNADRRQERLETGKCRRCPADAKPGSEYCAPHDAAQKRYQAKYLRRRRAQWKRRGLCKNDGRPRHGTSSLCAVCLTRLGRLKTSVGEKGVEKSARIAAATVVDKDGRTRYLGRRKRGAPGVGSVDRADLELAVQELIAALDGLGLYESTAGQELPRIQRQDLRQAYVGRAFASARAALDVCRRAGWTIPGLDGEDDDEPDIAATPRKGGR